MSFKDARTFERSWYVEPEPPGDVLHFVRWSQPWGPDVPLPLLQAGLACSEGWLESLSARTLELQAASSPLLFRDCTPKPRALAQSLGNSFPLSLLLTSLSRFYEEPVLSPCCLLPAWETSLFLSRPRLSAPPCAHSRCPVPWSSPTLSAS